MRDRVLANNDAIPVFKPHVCNAITDKYVVIAYLSMATIEHDLSIKTMNLNGYIELFHCCDCCHSMPMKMKSLNILVVLVAIDCALVSIVEGATSCSRGYYLDAENCYACPPGSFCPDGYRQLSCNPGQYQTDFGSSSCSSCPTGWYTLVKGSIVCTICPLGYMCPSADVNPVACSAGTYQDSYGSTNCQTCNRGRQCETYRLSDVLSTSNRIIAFHRILFDIDQFASMSNLSTSITSDFR
jgi:hypothetical protein